ncbi:uncharacterized protein LOC143512641 [Brachyhypopomus gauderio]|uniref:uncharacterized protein LOC143512641 n=1 Tax=Brachyhypopomus gauderio TaxID=698409 RepID=UPI0040421ECB
MFLIILLLLCVILDVYSQHEKPKLRLNFQHDEFIIVCEIPGGESVHGGFSCNLYTGNLRFMNRTTSLSRSNGKLHCSFTVAKNDLISHLQSAKSFEISCDYYYPSKNSSMSDKANITKWLPALTQLSITETSNTASAHSTSTITITHPTTSLPAHSRSLISPETQPVSSAPVSATPLIRTDCLTTGPATSRLQTQPTVFTLSTASSLHTSTINTAAGHDTANLDISWMFIVTGGSVLLAGLITCLCYFIRKQWTKRCEISSTSGNRDCVVAMQSVEESNPEVAGMNSDITSLPLLSQYSGSVKPIHHVNDSVPPAVIYSQITAVPHTLQSSGPKQILEEKGMAKEDNVHHVYCSIPDKRVVSKENDMVYSLLQKQ